MIHHYLFIHSHLLVSVHGDSSPFWDIHTSPLGLLLVWSFVLTIRRHRAGLAGGISGWGREKQKLEVQSTQEQLSSTQGSSRSSEGQSQSASREIDVFVRKWLESVSILQFMRCIFVAHCHVVYIVYFIQYSQCMYICCIFSYHCSLWMASTVLYCWILYLSVAALLIMMSIVLHRTWGVTPVFSLIYLSRSQPWHGFLQLVCDLC